MMEMSPGFPVPNGVPCFLATLALVLGRPFELFQHVDLAEKLLPCFLCQLHLSLLKVHFHSEMAWWKVDR